MLVTALPRWTPDGEFAGYAASAVDVTEIRRTEIAATQHRGQLAHLLRVESLDQLTLGLAHELHQPLTAITAATGASARVLASASPDLSLVREMVEEAQGQALRAGELVSQVREFIRRGALNHADLDLNELVHSVASLSRPEADRRGVQLTYNLGQGDFRVKASRLQIQQVLFNVVQNGFESMSGSGSSTPALLIETEATTQGELEIRVRDSGAGISREARHHMFDVFYTTRAEGLGMGLAICRSIVEAHGGSLRGENQPAGGAVFTVAIPRVAADPRSTRLRPPAE